MHRRSAHPSDDLSEVHSTLECCPRHLPQQWRLPPLLREKAKSMLELSTDKMLPIDCLEHETCWPNNVKALRHLPNTTPKSEGAPRWIHLHWFMPWPTRTMSLEQCYFKRTAQRDVSTINQKYVINATYKPLETELSCFLVRMEDGNGEGEKQLPLSKHETSTNSNRFFNAF